MPKLIRLSLKGNIAECVECERGTKGKRCSTSSQEILEFVKYAGDFYDSSYYVGRAIDVFGIEGARKIVAKGCRLGEAIEVYNYINDGNGTLEQLREF